MYHSKSHAFAEPVTTMDIYTLWAFAVLKMWQFPHTVDVLSDLISGTEHLALRDFVVILIVR